MKHLKQLIAVLSIVTILFSSKPSQAAVGAMVSVPAAVTAGVVIAGSGAGTWVLEVAMCPKLNCQGSGYLGMLIGIPLILLGLLVLDGEQSLSYAPLGHEAGKKLKLSSKEISSFNSEIDEVNNLAYYVDSELAAMGSDKPEEAAAIWNDVRASIAPETFSALVKVSEQLHRKALK